MNKPLLALLAAGALLLTAAPSQATLKMQKDAKAAGFAATNCLYCHNEKLPSKTKVSHNDRGEFLVATKEAKKAKEIDVTWLKDFVEKK